MRYQRLLEFREDPVALNFPAGLASTVSDGQRPRFYRSLRPLRLV